MAGDFLAGHRPAELAVSIRCRRSAGHRLQLVDEASVLFEQVIAEPDQSLAPRLVLAGSLFIRAELRDQQGIVKALSNPIYLPHP